MDEIKRFSETLTAHHSDVGNCSMCCFRNSRKICELIPNNCWHYNKNNEPDGFVYWTAFGGVNMAPEMFIKYQSEIGNIETLLMKKISRIKK
ncbi:MAG: hypothetical protein LBL75_03520 [Rickettsiales bacterium]|nr:hypothetical protein [Rickettsiales bacterium]